MLNKKNKYLQIALNSTLSEAYRIISQLPLDKRIIIEAGTPLIKSYGIEAIRKIKAWWEERIWMASQGAEVLKTNDFQTFLSFFKEKKQKKKPFSFFNPYIVADLKCMDRGSREVKIAKQGGANAVVALGHAPIETLNAFIETCEKEKVDAMIDMMNVDYPLSVLRKLKKPPHVVILHRGVDEERFNPESEIPYHEIQRIKSQYDIFIAVAGGDTFREVQRAIFNDADIVVVWKSFYQSSTDTAKLAQEFLKEIR